MRRNCRTAAAAATKKWQLSKHNPEKEYTKLSKCLQASAVVEAGNTRAVCNVLRPVCRSTKENHNCVLALAGGIGYFTLAGDTGGFETGCVSNSRDQQVGCTSISVFHVVAEGFSTVVKLVHPKSV